jgi:hypothetical protein
LRRRWLLRAGLLLALTLGAVPFVRSAHGQQPAADVPPIATRPSEQRGFVELTIAGTDDEAAVIVEALRELAARLGLGIRATRVEIPPRANTGPIDRDERAHVVVDDRFPERVEIQISLVKGGGFSPPVARSLPRGETSAISAEQVAHAIHSTLESLLSGGAGQGGAPAPAPVSGDAGAPAAADAAPPAVEASDASVAAPAVVPVPAPPAPTPPEKVVEQPPPAAVTPSEGSRGGAAFGLDAAAFGAGRGIARNVGPALGAGGAVDLTLWHGPWLPSLWVSGVYIAPFNTDQANVVSLDTQMVSVRVVPTVALLERLFLELDAGVGAGLDVFSTKRSLASSSEPGVTLLSTSPVPDFVLSAQVVARVRLTSSLRALVGLGLDYDPYRPRYQSDEVGSPNATAVLEPWLLRPSAIVGLCVALVGTVACAEP